MGVCNDGIDNAQTLAPLYRHDMDVSQQWITICLTNGVHSSTFPHLLMDLVEETATLRRPLRVMMDSQCETTNSVFLTQHTTEETACIAKA